MILINKNYFKSVYLLLMLTMVAFTGRTQDTKVMVLEIREEIDHRMSRYVELGLEDATEKKAGLVILDMDTYGGGLYDADKITSLVLKYPKPVYVFINNNAASAGSFIAIACDSIYMAPGATIGASTVVNQEGKAVSEKYQSYMRSKMRSTAMATGRDTTIAQAFVGVNVSKDSLYHEGRVLTLTTSEAMKVGYCQAQVKSIDEILKRSNVSHYQLLRYELSTLEEIEVFFLNPYLKSVLILIIIAGIYFEMQHPGLGFPILAALIACLLYFIPSYLHGFAQNWEILVFIAGIVLLALEIFVIPGFGIAGISGIILTLGGLLLVMIPNKNFDFTFVTKAQLVQALTVLLIGMAGGVLILVTAGRKLLESKAFKKLTLQEKLESSEGYVSTFFKEPMVGKTGIAYTVLRPSGKVKIGDDIFDAYSRNEFIEQGTEVVVIEASTTSLKVKRKE